MITYSEKSSQGIVCYQIQNQDLRLDLSKDFGPRVMGLSYQGSENMLACLPDAKLAVRGGKAYSLRGGHRLWYAPEKPETTYITDDRPPQVKEIKNGLELIQNVDQPTGIQKSWEVRLDVEAAEVVIDHRLTNCGEKNYALAPWAVTMLRTGGVGLLPLQEERDDEHGLWPNRQLVLWPYTDVESRYLRIANQGVFLLASMPDGALKIGTANPRGWIAYRQDDLLFVKETRYLKEKNYLDRGASHQIFCNPDVIELETLGPLTDLAPGEAVGHQEIWRVYPEGSWPEEIYRIFKTAGF